MSDGKEGVVERVPGAGGGAIEDEAAGALEEGVSPRFRSARGAVGIPF